MSERAWMRPRKSARRVASCCLGAGAIGLSMSGCLTRPVDPVEPKSTSTIVEQLKQTAVDKIDLLLMVDDSSSMADKQTILQQAVPFLVKSLVNPGCIDDTGKVVSTPAGPLDACPDGTTREFDPILDVHVGVVDSSLGAHGGTICSDAWDATQGGVLGDDHGHLVTRAPGGGVVPTYLNQGFLAWDPKGQLSPPGDNVLGDDKSGFVGKVADLVVGAGENGCGYESQLESWYRFLIEPDPPKGLTQSGTKYVSTGLDEELIQERQDFLRPDSLLAILMLTDENDCSLRDDYGYYFTNGNPPPGRAICKTNPDDPCCFPCGQPDGSCGHDPTCDAAPPADLLDLRCFDQKRRFGVDLLYPIQRYVDGLTQLSVQDSQGNVVPNPIFAGQSSPNSTVRDPSLVFLAGIVGVPWQDIARQDASGKPDLTAGLDSKGNAVGGLKTAEELALPAVGTSTGWDIILGDPTKGVAPRDPLMIESQTARSGRNPITGDPLAMPGSAPNANPINGHEWNTSENTEGDLEYACIFDLPTTEPCSDPYASSPLCQDASGTPTTQYRAKGYPGVRELEVLQGIGAQGIVGSVCAAQMNDDSKPDYGYQPAIGALVDRLKQRLGNKCLPHELHLGDDQEVPCVVLEARTTPDGSCDCTGAARAPVSAEHAAAEQAAAGLGSFNCFCEVTQLSGAAETACEDDTSMQPTTPDGKNVDGWCYVDPSQGLGAQALVSGCPDEAQHEIRFVGKGRAVTGATLLLTCSE